MKRFYLTCILLIIVLPSRAQFNKTIDFNNYVSPTNNDFVNNFVNRSYLLQVPTNGITGGCLSVDGTTRVLDSDALYERSLLLSNVPTEVSISVKFDSSLLHSISFGGAFDVHYKNADSSDAFYIVLYSQGCDISTSTAGPGWSGSSFTHSFSNYKRFADRHWYRCKTSVALIGNDTSSSYATVRTYVFDLDTNGLGIPILLDSFSQDSVKTGLKSRVARVALSSATTSGAKYLDNLNIVGVDAIGISKTQLTSGLRLPTIFEEHRLPITSGLNAMVDYELYSITGSMIRRGRFISGATLTDDGLASGNYFIRFTCKGAATVKRVIVR